MNFRKPSKPVEYAISAIALAPALYWALTESGPFRWLMAFETRQFGRSSSHVSLALIALAIYAPVRFFVALRVDERVVDPAEPQVSDLPRAESPAMSAAIAAGAAAIFIGLAAILYWKAPHGPPTKTAAADFNRAKVQEGSLVELDAKTRDNALSVQRESGERTLYVPLAEAAVVVSFDAADKHRLWVDGQLRAVGVARRGVNNVLRDDLANAGIEVGPDAWLVRVRSRDGFERWGPSALAIFGLLFAPVAYRMRRRASAASPHAP